MNNKLYFIARGNIYLFFHCCGGIVDSVILLFNVQRIISAVVNAFIGGNFRNTVRCGKAPVYRLAARSVFKVKVRVFYLARFGKCYVIYIHIHSVRGA